SPRRRLDDAEETREDPQHPALGTRRHGVGRRRLGEDTAVAGPPARGVDADLPLELADRGADVGHALCDAGVVYDVARLERVRAVDDDVVVADELPRVLLGDAD